MEVCRMIEKKLFTIVLWMTILAGPITIFSAIDENVPLKKPPLFPSVRTYCYLPGYLSSPLTRSDDTLLNWWINHFDMMIVDDATTEKAIKTASPKATDVVYGEATFLTAYNSSTDSYTYTMDTLKKWVTIHYASYGFTSPSAALENCFLHAKRKVIVNFAMGGSDTIPAYNPANPRLSRLPSTW
jgi:hypothetical protein